MLPCLLNIYPENTFTGPRRGVSPVEIRFSCCHHERHARDRGMSPAPSIVPEFVYHDSARHYVFLTLVLCLTFTSIFVFIRLFTKTFVKFHGWEDCKGLFSLSLLAQTSSVWLMIRYQTRLISLGYSLQFPILMNI